MEKPLYTKWFTNVNDDTSFNGNFTKDLAKLGGVQQAEKELDKNVLEIKHLVKNRRYIKNYV